MRRLMLPLMLVTALLTSCHPGKVHVTGSVTLTRAGNFPLALCDAAHTSGIPLIFRDGTGAVIGTTTTEAIPPAGTQLYQVFAACYEPHTYSVDLPHADFYQVEIRGVPIDENPISFDDLKARDFKLDISA